MSKAEISNASIACVCAVLGIVETKDAITEAVLTSSTRGYHGGVQHRSKLSSSQTDFIQKQRIGYEIECKAGGIRGFVVHKWHLIVTGK